MTLKSYYKDKLVLVTGGAGFIGSHLVKALARVGAHVVVLDSLTYASDASNLYDEDLVVGSLYPVDITHQTAYNFVSRYNPDIIFHLAAETHVDNSILHGMKFVNTDVLGTANLLEACRNLPDLEKFVYVSTDEVYGSIEGAPVTEEGKFNPSSPYSASKAAADHLAMAYYKTHKIPVVIARPSNAYGPYQHPEKLIPKFICNGILGRRMPIYGDGTQVRMWTHVTDVVSALWHLGIFGESGEAYNVTSGIYVKNIDVTQEICANLGLLGKDVLEFVDDRLAHDVKYSIDGSKLQNLKWEPSYKNFKEGLKQTVQWYVQNRWWWESKIL